MVRTSCFQGVILAGGEGSRMSPLTNDDSSLPKAMLPVLNRPLLYYALKWMDMNNVAEVFVVAREAHESTIRHYISEVYDMPDDIKIELIFLNETTGTVDALRAVKEKIKGDFVVMPVDLITDTSLASLAALHWTTSASVTALFIGPQQKGEDAEPQSHVPHRIGREELYVGLDAAADCRRLVLYVDSGDLADETELPIRLSLNKKYPWLRLHRNLHDGHLYIFRKWVLELIARDTEPRMFSSIRFDLIPYLVKLQNRGPKYAYKVLGEPLAKVALRNSQSDAFALSTAHTEMAEEYITCSAVVLQPTSYAIRTNTIPSYLEANRLLARTPFSADESLIGVHASAQVDPKTQVGQDSSIGARSVVSEKTSVKRSSVGSGCTIGKFVKLNNSVIMDNVIIEDNCKIDNCVIGPNAHISKSSSLLNCDVAFGYKVREETNAKNEKLSSFGFEGDEEED